MTASKRDTGSDLAKVDAYENTPADYEELPELDDAFFERATTNINEAPRMGRPPIGDRPKQQVTLRLNPSIIEHFRATGPGWQGRINDVLAKFVKMKTEAAPPAPPAAEPPSAALTAGRRPGPIRRKLQL